MGQSRSPEAALLVVAGFSRRPEALEWAAQRLSETYGTVALTSPAFDFHHTRYYESTMGPGLRKQFLVFADRVCLDSLPDIKRHTNSLEGELAGSGTYPEGRPLNLDPGLLTLGKFILATTKDQAHRIYMRDGIFAEITLRFEAGQYVPWPWTYADYREPEVRAFLKEAREYYRARLRGA